MSAAPRPTPPRRADRPRRTRGRIDVEHFDFWYGEKQALFDINLSHRAARRARRSSGRRAAASRPSCARSTGMNELIPGARHAGEIRLDGENIYQKGMDVVTLRQRVGMVFQRWNPFPEVDLRQRRLRAADQRRPQRAELDAIVESALRRAALWDEVKDRLRDSALALSGGQQQRLCIARALANDPEVLLLDEPASRARSRSRRRRSRSWCTSCKRELTIVIVTHNLQQAARVSDRTAFFYLGKLDRDGRHRSGSSRARARSAPRRTSRGDSDDAQPTSPASATFTTSWPRSSSACSTCRRRRRRCVDLSVDALLSRDARQGRRGDRRRPRARRAWSSRSRPAALELLALQQPMARDLRFIVSAIKVTNDLERVGDHAVNIAQSALRLVSQRTHITPDPEIDEMARRARADAAATRSTRSCAPTARSAATSAAPTTRWTRCTTRCSASCSRT